MLAVTHKPDAWPVMPLGRLLRRPPQYGINAAAVPSGTGDYAYIRITDIDDSGRFSPQPKVEVRHRNTSNYLLRQGELLFARTGASVGKSYLYDKRDGDLVYAGFLINVAPDPRVLMPKFLALFVQTQHYWDWVTRTSARSGQPGINGREYARLEVPVPELRVQKSIAAVGTDADELITTLEQAIKKKQAIKQGMMQQLLTGRTRLPGFTERRHWHRLDDLCERIQDGTHFSPALGGVEFKYITSRNIGSGFLKLDSVETISKAEHQRIFERCGTRYGDLLLTKDGANTGNMAINTLHEEISLLSSVAFIRANPKLVLEMYVMQYLMSSEGHSQIIDAMSGNAITRLTLQKIRDLRIPVPQIEEQKAITRILGDMDAEIRQLHVRLAKAEAVKRGMMQELLTGRTRLPVKEGVEDERRWAAGAEGAGQGRRTVP